MLETYEANKKRVLYAQMLKLEKQIDDLEYIGEDFYWTCKNYPLRNKLSKELREVKEEYYRIEEFWEKDREHFKKYVDLLGDEIEYDRAGNRKYQFQNLKTGEMV